MTDDPPTCDLTGCDAEGYARYQHCRGNRWIDVCAEHRPIGVSCGTVNGVSVYYHTRKHSRYPAETPSAVHNSSAFIRRGQP